MSDASKVGVGLAIIGTTVLAILVMATLMAGPASAAHCDEDLSTQTPVCAPGHVWVDNLPADQPVTVSNWPADQPVTVSNFPASETVTVSNWPTVQDVFVTNQDGTVTSTRCTPATTAVEPASTAEWDYQPEVVAEGRDPECASIVWAPALDDIGFDLRRNLTAGLAILVVLQSASLVVAMRR